MTTGWCHRSRNRSPNSRAATSGELPGPNGTMKRTGRCGHASAAKAWLVAVTTIAAARKSIRLICTRLQLDSSLSDGAWRPLAPAEDRAGISFVPPAEAAEDAEQQ